MRLEDPHECNTILSSDHWGSPVRPWYIYAGRVWKWGYTMLYPEKCHLVGKVKFFRAPHFVCKPSWWYRRQQQGLNWSAILAADPPAALSNRSHWTPADAVSVRRLSRGFSTRPPCGHVGEQAQVDSSGQTEAGDQSASVFCEWISPFFVLASPNHCF